MGGGAGGLGGVDAELRGDDDAVRGGKRGRGASLAVSASTGRGQGGAFAGMDASLCESDCLQEEGFLSRGTGEADALEPDPGEV